MPEGHTRHEIQPEIIVVNPLDIISKDGDPLIECDVIDKTCEIANLALREYGIQLDSQTGIIRGNLNDDDRPSNQ